MQSRKILYPFNWIDKFAQFKVEADAVLSVTDIQRAQLQFTFDKESGILNVANPEVPIYIVIDKYDGYSN